MASSYVNNLRLNEMATGDASGTWGTTTNTNLELIGEALGFGTEGITTNADTHSTVVADGSSDAGRAMYLKYTGTLDSACTITITPNTMKRMQFIENGTSGSQNIIISQGSGANITIPPGDTKAVYLDGAGSGAAVVDAFASLNVVDLKVQDDLTVTDDVIIGGDIDLEGSIDVNGTANLDIVDIDGAVNMATTALVTGVLTTTAATVFNGGFASNADSTMGTNKKIQFRDAAIHISSSADGQLDLVADTEIQIAATTIDINGAINASGEIIAASLDISGNVDIDGVLETDNLTVGSDQGNDGQVLTSTGSGVAWEDASGGATDIDGLSDAKSGGTNFSNSLFLGHQTTGTLNNANNNTAVGYGAMDAVTAGADSTAIGKDAMTTATTSDSSVAVGAFSMAATTTGNDNTAVGWRSLFANTTGPQNVAVGKGALAANTTGEANTGIGYLALTTNTTGQGEAFGANALTAQTTGSENQAFGLNALAACTTGTSNVAVGKGAFQALTTGSDSVAIGRGAGDAVTTAASNTFVGSQAGGSNTSGSSNVALGAAALTTNTSGAGNIAIGVGALRNNTTAGEVTGAGDGCLAANTSGALNTAYGAQSLAACTTGSSNVAIGGYALNDVTTGATNTAVGAVSLDKNTTGANNVAVGKGAGGAVTSGSNNVFLGVSSGQANQPIGEITTQSNIIIIGNADHTASHVQVDWTVASDKRDKTDVTPLDMGLSFINKLEPVTYKWDKRVKYEEGKNPDGTHKESWTDVGFLAQDVEKIEAEFGHQIKDETNLTTHMSEDESSYGLTYAKFVPMLVKAVQELSMQVDELKSELLALKGE